MFFPGQRRALQILIYIIKQDIRVYESVAYCWPNGWTEWAEIFCGHSKVGGGVFFKGTMPGPSASYLIIVKVGELKEELSLFWEKSRHLMGWNGAHNSFPHITLSSSFTCPDSQVEALMHAISKVFIYKNI